MISVEEDSEKIKNLEEKLSEVFNLLKEEKDNKKIRREWVIDKIRQNSNKPNLIFSFYSLIIGLIIIYIFILFPNGREINFIYWLTAFLVSSIFLSEPIRHFYYFISGGYPEEKINLTDEEVEKYLLDYQYLSMCRCRNRSRCL
ncbi:MAG: hypothetical protein AM1032_000158 [Mycoplasmataceae bacterium]|nr:MAG: hypothetical protein AM1032_000158 [Mycoplasmataceae bacterium]